MLQSSALVSLLTVLLYIAGIFGFAGGQPNNNATGNLADSGSINNTSSSFNLSTGGKVKVGDTVNISGKVVNVRSGPGTKYPVLGEVHQGQTASIENGDAGWLKLRFGGSLTGWVADWLVKPGIGLSGAIAPHVPSGIQSLGYYAKSSPEDTTSLQAMAKAGNSLTGVVPFLFSVDAYGNVSGENDWQALQQAKKAGQTTLALVHNIKGDWFNKEVGHNLLAWQTNRTRAINGILKVVEQYGYDGVNIDFESIAPADRQNLTTFLRELSWALRPKGYLLTISVPAKVSDDPNHNWSGAYDYKAIGEYVDWMMIMAYDQHYKTGTPGPVAAVDWVERVVKYATSVVPAQKIILGVPTYGYDWPLNGKDARSVSYAQAMKIAKDRGITPKWHSTYKTPYFSYETNGLKRQVWFESSWSLEHKLQVVKDYGLKGIALWRLGLEDPRTWEVIESHLY